MMSLHFQPYLPAPLLRPADYIKDYTGRELERPGGHSFIPRKRAFQRKGDRRTKAIM